MKSILFHSVPVFLSMVWLISYNDTYNPIALKGPDFLKFYMILLTGFYLSILILKYLNKAVSKTTFYFMISIFILGIVKLVRGIFLGKPVGFLILILILEFIVILFINLNNLKFKLK